MRPWAKLCLDVGRGCNYRLFEKIAQKYADVRAFEDRSRRYRFSTLTLLPYSQEKTDNIDVSSEFFNQSATPMEHFSHCGNMYTVCH